MDVRTLNSWAKKPKVRNSVGTIQDVLFGRPMGKPFVAAICNGGCASCGAAGCDSGGASSCSGCGVCGCL